MSLVDAPTLWTTFRWTSRHRRIILLACFLLVTAVTWFAQLTSVSDFAYNTVQDAVSMLREDSSASSLQLDDGQVMYLPDWKDISLKQGRILVTGGGGNIGKILIRRLLSSNVPVTALDVIFHHDELRTIRDEFPGADLVHESVDIRNVSAIQSILQGTANNAQIEGIINLAAISRVLWCLENERDCNDINVQAVDGILATSRAVSEARDDSTRPWLVQASSREVYGVAEEFPVHEDMPTTPANVYGVSKLAAEQVIQRHVDESNSNSIAKHSAPLNAICLRLSNVYGGEYDHQERLVPAIMTRAIAGRPIQIVGGKQNLDMVHVDDTVDAMILAVLRLSTRQRRQHASQSNWVWTYKTISASHSVVEYFNVVGRSAAPAMELVTKILKMTRSLSPVQLIPADERFPDLYEGSSTKARAVLGYTARVAIDTGLHRLAQAYYRQSKRYLDKAYADTCDVKSYDRTDLLKLDGCLGSLVANVDDMLVYLDWDPKKADWLWTENLAPRSFKFEIQDKGGPAVELNIKDWTLAMSSRVTTYGDTGRFFNVTAQLASEEIINTTSVFLVDLDSTSGYVSLRHMASDRFLVPPEKARSEARISKARSDTDMFRFRLVPTCCSRTPAPWPFFREDPVESLINDYRDETPHYFNASHIKVHCAKLEQATQVNQAHLSRLEGYAEPIALSKDNLPTGNYSQWGAKALPACANLCEHPSICLDTGACACVQHNCVNRARFPFSAFANVDRLSYPLGQNSATDPDSVLVAQVERTSWLSVLHPPASRYLSRNPLFPHIVVGKPPDWLQSIYTGNPHRYTEEQNESGCFSADVSLHRTLQIVNNGSTIPPEMLLIPYLERMASQDLSKVLGQTTFPALPSNESAALDLTKVVTFTHDWGICNRFAWTVFEARYKGFKVPDCMDENIAWSVMGDLNSNCYRPDRDIIIPPRTCLSSRLFKKYADLRQVTPIRRRKILATFSGSVWGTGATARKKVMCDRLKSPGRLLGAEALPTFWGSLGPHKDYLEMLDDVVFCPLIRGTTGWATRTSDVIYAGCIPVIIGKGAHFPFWDMIDYSKISINIPVNEVDRLEEILLSYTWEQLETMQANLMLVRDAFMYPLDGDEMEGAKRRGPAFFALHSTALRGFTKYPLAQTDGPI